MSESTDDYMPSGGRKFLEWAKRHLGTLDKIRERIGFPKDKYDEAVAKLKDFEEKLDRAEHPETRSPYNVAKKDTAMKSQKKLMRKNAQMYLFGNENVTPEDRVALGLTTLSETITRAPIEWIAPSVITEVMMARILLIHFFAFGTKKGARKPKMQHGAEICFWVGSEPVRDLKLLYRSAFSTRTPFQMEFTDEERGKIFSFAIRWENTRGEKGHWSEIYTVMVP
jgi:hypothetical protein